MQAALTVVAFVLSSLFGILHDASTMHMRCAEHGEMIHTSATLVDGQRQAPVRVATLRTGEAAAVSGHEHCALASAIREPRMMPSPPAVEAAPAAAIELAVAIAYDGAARERGVYRTAPKTSPPA